MTPLARQLAAEIAGILQEGTGFRARNKQGQTVTGIVCAGSSIGPRVLFD